MKIHGTLAETGEPAEVVIADQHIEAVSARLATDSDLGGDDYWLVPGLIDIQVNGFGGFDLNVPGTTAGDVASMVNALYQVGVTQCLPTICTASHEQMLHSLHAIDEACEDPRIAQAIVGVHIEGPYISSMDGARGAHPMEHTRDPDSAEFHEFNAACGGRIRIVTLAPERHGSFAFIRELAAMGIVVAIGHTAASPEAIAGAVTAGARLSTHLGNGCADMIQRHHNHIWAQLAADELWASLIVDGHHLPAEMVKSLVRAKGLERIILTSDAIAAAGMPPGTYEFGGKHVEVTDDLRVQLPGTPYLAGSALQLSVGVANAVRFAGISLGESVRACTVNPARMLGLQERQEGITAGAPADLVLFRWDESRQSLEVTHTIAAGEVVYAVGG